MTLDEFFAALPKDGWYLTDGGAIRRGIMDGVYASCECPVIAAANSKFGTELTMKDLLKAESMLGLSLSQASLIVEAADNDNDNDSNGLIRHALLKHCGLS